MGRTPADGVKTRGSRSGSAARVGPGEARATLTASQPKCRPPVGDACRCQATRAWAAAQLTEIDFRACGARERADGSSLSFDGGPRSAVSGAESSAGEAFGERTDERNEPRRRGSILAPWTSARWRSRASARCGNVAGRWQQGASVAVAVAQTKRAGARSDRTGSAECSARSMQRRDHRGPGRRPRLAHYLLPRRSAWALPDHAEAVVHGAANGACALEPLVRAEGSTGSRTRYHEDFL